MDLEMTDDNRFRSNW